MLEEYGLRMLRDTVEFGLNYPKSERAKKGQKAKAKVDN